MKVKINHKLAVTFSAAGEVEFGKEFLAKVDACAQSLGRDFNAKVTSVDLNTKSIIAEFLGIDLGLASDLKSKLVQEIVLLAEHGPNSDVLDQLLNRYPKLRNHPNLTSVVRAFENMNQVIDQVLGDQSNSMKAKLQQREGLELDPEDLVASQRTKKTMTPEERVEFRTLAILGQTKEQVESKSRVVKDDAAGIPDVYRKVAKQQNKTVDPEAIGDAGNVFTRPAKGSKP